MVECKQRQKCNRRKYKYSHTSRTIYAQDLAEASFQQSATSLSQQIPVVEHHEVRHASCAGLTCVGVVLSKPSYNLSRPLSSPNRPDIAQAESGRVSGGSGAELAVNAGLLGRGCTETLRQECVTQKTE